ncbi:DegT/DnrJ/EryC1/StrS family aminotransferase [Streptomyces sp. AJS327]|uniref:DegT/DnrJ/EryC1/StrS family aminotransferase n=1 Tax=Streptomyces sp. AJS327 TaxID=2545265 RepID=UPI0015DD6DBC|nr:DegT/DnrJ/EryC1/StrS family aminotransferase [Streptomyces sp. AJS327]MBA0052905.1 DegT/DnrJ/EryC1/StrS family aminotransferase [Streptomyces sp. AJS327]
MTEPDPASPDNRHPTRAASPTAPATPGGAPPDGGWRYEPSRALALWDEREVEAAVEVLRSRSLFRYYGPRAPRHVDAFEAAFAERTGCPYAVGVSSGTAALTAALVGLGIPEGAEVVIPAVTFVGSVSAVVAARGVPVFADIDDSLTLDPAALESAVTERTWGVLPVHLNNAAADMDPLLRVAERHGLRVVEDAAQAAGVNYRGRPAGSLGDAGAFSFQQDKNLTAGEGGAVTLRDAAAHQRVVRFQDQGGQFSTSRGPGRGGPEPEGEAEVAPFLGCNLRMTELAGAILTVQLDRLDGMNRRLREVARRVRASVSDLPLEWRQLPDEEGSGGDLTALLGSRLQARRFTAALHAEGVPAHTLYQGRTVTSNPAVRDGRTAWGVRWERPPRMRTSEGIIGRSVTVGLGAAMTEADVEGLTSAVRKAAEESLR